MQVTNKAFKAYDVRGVYPTEVNEEMAYRMGRIFSAMFAAETVVVGHDIRLSGRALVDALTEGLRHGGTRVIDIGQWYRNDLFCYRASESRWRYYGYCQP